MKKGLIVAPILLTLSLTGCGPNLGFDAVEGETLEDIEEKSLVYGYLETGDTGVELDAVGFQNIDQGSEQSYDFVEHKGGLFFSATLSPGTYRLARLDVIDPAWIPFFGRDQRYILKLSRQMGEKFIFNTEEPGIYYLGSFRLEGDGNSALTAFLRNNDYNIAVTDEPSPKSLLKRLKKEANGTPWVPRIQSALESNDGEGHHARK